MSSVATLSSRSRLPNRRESTTLDLPWGRERYHITYSLHTPPNALGYAPLEVFISGPKAGTDLYALCNTASVIISIALQHGVPLKVLADAVLRDEEGNPADIVGAVIDSLVAEMSPGVEATHATQGFTNKGAAPGSNLREASSLLHRALPKLL